jgi:protoheme ferro-lyase
MFQNRRGICGEGRNSKEIFSVAFQSRLGRDPWLKPYTDLELAEFPKRGVKRLLVICAAFVSDCLETLEEINICGRETFLQAGGKEFAQIPCLNEHPLWISTLEKMARRFFCKRSGIYFRDFPRNGFVNFILTVSRKPRMPFFFFGCAT